VPLGRLRRRPTGGLPGPLPGAARGLPSPPGRAGRGRLRVPRGAGAAGSARQHHPPAGGRQRQLRRRGTDDGGGGPGRCRGGGCGGVGGGGGWAGGGRGRYVPVRPGRAVVTSAGSLPARFVFHGVTLGASRDPSVRPSRDLISETLASCFYHADSLRVQTIA